EQRQILSGIISQAQKRGAQILTLSNLYNPLEPEHTDCTDNRIYDLLCSDVFDALILLTESVVNPALRRKLNHMLQKKPSVPVVLIGAPVPEFDAEQFLYLNTSDENDFEAITDHLIEDCGFRNITMLTGPLSIAVSHSRVNGYRRSLEKHGFPYDESQILEGDFWYHSGEQLAQKSLSAERPEPEALICANDYMAFGLLDTFSASGTDITAHFAVIGYEYIAERTLHTPLLTTFQRNRSALGAAAVDLLMQRRHGEPDPPFSSPQGKLIGGQTVRSSGLQLHDELRNARILQHYAEWNLKSEMESRLTECGTIEAFVEIMGEFLHLVRNAGDIILCLFEDWYRQNDSESQELICRHISTWADRTPFFVEKMQLPALIRRYEYPAAYLNQVFFKDRLLGYCIVYYDHPDTYDDTYRSWLKTVSNCLEFMRLKGDVRYLLQCRKLSPSYDSMTGVFSADGMRDAMQQMLNAQQPDTVTAVAVRLLYPQDALSSTEHAKETVTNLTAAVSVMKRFHGKGSIIGRISKYEFLLLFPSCEDDALLADAIKTEILSDADFRRNADTVQLFLCCRSTDHFNFSQIMQSTTSLLEDAEKQYQHAMQLPHFQKLEHLHKRLIRQPQNACSLENAAEALHLNPNHFNRIYRRFFGISFHRDCIQARLLPAKHLLLTTDDTAVRIAERCGYTDSKYFTRQFSAETGYTPIQYRNALRDYLG
ncbi:MAG: substrate-binding domain-containing protein, partial [Oscillospiraceae bacterium]|nr:substrate-binding domain-containing protein [Oscillospiraceae bacterium]